MQKDIFLGLGSNVGDRNEALKTAIELLQKTETISVLECSNVYETKPVGVTDQADFLNLVLKAATSSPPQELLQVTQSIEKEMGRIKDVRWGPRNIDLDILLYNDENIMMEELIIPHPRMAERAFVLIPLMDVISNSKTDEVKHWLSSLPAEEKAGVRLYKQTDGWLT
ncbi:2-amino-4-hydroxy-6-hydroxymethyldihydropteridine diphosphokinase [Sinobaca qinghaiensis]|uniref:2-amino-4-hydroxy-6-hydroxymethyldihydropteridine diphosphokinase n=1 Tax=Sinobaca qinghaiensis TaxID=342944 RepID=A0A419VU05_9BACL|nr:2-amino-4-hydroxy-6-hydroxymethyldihydropteridine diphosphokinase [Sinobaca qinghaiensis]RKD84135.1 2-amino-4-hydroxy-6-hydroxymethyldihydropteridine diphosphokinase [Sinobaca qinghaiensis]